VTQQGGRVFVPQAAESFTYDFDGNMTSDGRWSYTWDGENRLASMEAIPSVPIEAKQRLEFAYDSMGRRIQKKVYGWDVPSSTYQLRSTTKFIYDGWNLMAELDASGLLIRSYSWGQDLSGTLTGAGGIGGLLLLNGAGTTYHVAYDGNGNVSVLIRASAGSVSGSYEYDPFGNTVKSTGDYAGQNPFRFTTKYMDQETGLLYYGYRYNNSQIGRWLSRDLLGEEGDINLYRHDDNDPIRYIDPLGSQKVEGQAYPEPKGPGYRTPFGERLVFDKNSPNWTLEGKGPFHHTHHSIWVSLCGFKNAPSRDEMIDKVYTDLERFEHFNEPTNNIATVSIGGSRGHFSISSPVASAASALAGNSIDVEFDFRRYKHEIIAVTIGDHPLVGVRKWWVEYDSAYEKSFHVYTEAYEKDSGFLNAMARPITPAAQDRMWSTYLDNIGLYWRKNYHAYYSGRVISRFDSVGGDVNPFRSQLPERLQYSRFFTSPYYK
jgi:RHS repeat-associated protein